ncbi:TetR/AcrR family transcriptional regulator [Varibaculum vaginae]|uniref:TetR/AcrR family transcriptional regulator n=1 Tax=Varibaculum vaginae TaxID=2364797 RepID=UPI000F0851C6|nr:TetR/AcrR family transcriptional regulator [Varibaculum vaginae]
MTTSLPMPPTVSARREVTRQKLFASARELFAKEGLSKTGVKTLCEAAGFSRGAFYSNFPDFSEFLRQYIHGEFTRVSEQLSQAQTLIEPVLFTETETCKDSFLTTHWPSVSEAIASTMLFERDFVLVLTELRIYAARNREFLPILRAEIRVIEEQLAQIITNCLRSLGLHLQVQPLECAFVVIALWQADLINRSEEAESGQVLRPSSHFLEAALPCCLAGMVASE